MSAASGEAAARRFTLAQVANHVEAEMQGIDESARDALISGIGSLGGAQPDQLAFLSSPRFRDQLADSEAAAVMVTADVAEQSSRSLLVCDSPYLAYARLSQLFDTAPIPPAGIHPSAVVEPGAEVAADACIGPNVVIDRDAVIGAGSWIGAGSVIGQRSRIGSRCRIAANVTLYHDVSVGDDCFIHSGAVLGGDGFGFAPTSEREWERIAQNGAVQIGNGVSIGANATVDRGAIGDTVIEDGVVIDNLCQIAHNVHIGRHTGLAAMCGISGSTRIGAYCTLAGNVGTAGHIEIVDGVHINGRSAVTNSIKEKGAWACGTTPILPARQWRRVAVRVTQLEQLNKRVGALEKKLDKP